MKKIILATVLLIVAVGGYIAYTRYRQETPDVVNRTPDAATDVPKLIAAFETDTAAAAKAYIGKVVEVTGRVKSIDTTGAIVLGAEGNPSEVVVGLDRRHLADHRKLKPGFVTVVQGICSGFRKSGGDPDDLLAGLGTTVEFRSAGVKNKQ